MARNRWVRLLSLIFLTVSLFGCDHATKLAAKASLESSAAVPVAPGLLRGALELRYVENDDIAFSALHVLGVPRSPAVLAGLSVVAILAVIAMAIAARLRKREAGETPQPNGRAVQVGFALILAGALGNVVDRIVRGYVVDFIHVKGWPVFNVADIAVVAGVALIGLSRLRRRRLSP